MRSIVSLVLFLVPVIARAQATYTIDPAHSAAEFSIKHLMVSNVKGQFNNLKGTITYDANNLAASKVEATVDATTINTRELKRDAHLKSPDFFEVEKYPTFTFTSKQFYRDGAKLKVKGDLNMHGITKEVVLDVDGPTAEIKDPMGNMRFGAEITTTVNRKDWGLNWNRAIEAGGVVVGDEVKITLDIEATRKK
jgi:polyisoprenoid-binding protein YceI